MGVRLKTMYNQQIVPFLMQKFLYANIDQAPKIEKIVAKCAVGDLAQNARGLDVAMNDLSLITGQRPNKTGEVAFKARTKHSMSSYGMNDGKPLGLVVTLRGNSSIPPAAAPHSSFCINLRAVATRLISGPLLPPKSPGSFPPLASSSTASRHRHIQVETYACDVFFLRSTY